MKLEAALLRHPSLKLLMFPALYLIAAVFNSVTTSLTVVVPTFFAICIPSYAQYQK